MQSTSSEVQQTENTSGKGAAAIVPPEIRGWNWGAFYFSWIWGIPHNTWLSFLALIPYLGIVMQIILGIKGSEWAWQNRRFEGGVEEFKLVQRIWAKWALIVFLVVIISAIVIAILTAVLLPLLAKQQREAAASLTEEARLLISLFC